jgi:radical SAM superfamily enzyme YgiQ (UPF0313 family)
MILLTYPPFKEGGRSFRWSGTSETKGSNFFYPPWYLAYSAAILEKDNIPVDLIDAVATGMDNNSFVKYVDKKNPELLIAEVSTLTINKDLQLMRRIKKDIGCKIALTGSHVTTLCKEILSKNPFIDFILFGEYELTVKDLANKLQTKNYNNILGLAFRQNDKIKINKRRPLIENLDELPLPARHFLPMDKYNEAFAEVPNQQMLSSRGCPYQCVFCVLPQIYYNRRVRYRSPKNVINEMQLVVEEYKPKEIYFDDDSFTLNSQHVLGICKEIKNCNLDVQWSCMGHAKINEKILREMVDSGCVGVKFGVETASPVIQDKIKKRLNLDEIKNFVKLAKKFKLRTHATYTIGLPGDTKETIKQTLKFAANLNTDSMQISIATPYPGTEFYNWCESNGYLITKDFSRYDGNKEAVVSYPDLSKKDIDEMFKKSLDLVSRFNSGMIKCFLLDAFKNGGFKGLITFTLKEGTFYTARLLRKHLFILKSKFS